MPLHNSYVSNIVWQQSQYNNFQDCSTLGEILERYHQMVWAEHLAGSKSESEYFLDFVEEAKTLIQTWADSDNNEQLFLQKAKLLSDNIFSIAETVVSGDYFAINW